MDAGGNQGYRSGNARSILPSMITFILISIGLTAFGVASARYGTDSRSVFDERREGERFGSLR
jgi:hypothetical protein